MRDRSAAFDTIQEPGRRFPVPILERFLAWETIKSSVDFHRGKLRCIKCQLLAHRQLRGIKILCPALVGPAACSDVNAADFHEYLPYLFLCLEGLPIIERVFSWLYARRFQSSHPQSRLGTCKALWPRV